MSTLSIQLYIYGPGGLFIYFTNWGLMASTLQLYLTISCATDLDLSSRITMMGFNHILFELSLIMEIIITAVYWSMIHDVVIEVETDSLAIF